MATQQLFPSNYSPKQNYLLINSMIHQSAPPINHINLQQAISSLFITIEHFFEDKQSLARFTHQFYGKKILQKLILENKGNLGSNYQGYIGQVMRALNRFQGVPNIQYLQHVLSSQFKIFTENQNYNFGFLQVQTPFMIASKFQGSMPPKSYEILYRMIHLLITRRELFNKNSECIFWTSVEVAKEFYEGIKINPNQNQKNIMITGQDYHILKKFVKELVK